MKGIIIVATSDVQRLPALDRTLRQHSDFVESDGERSMFHSKDGVLMTVICELLNYEVKYVLNFPDGTPAPNNKQVHKHSGTPTGKVAS